jgi:hypothetical protein
MLTPKSAHHFKRRERPVQTSKEKKRGLESQIQNVFQKKKKCLPMYHGSPSMYYHFPICRFCWWQIHSDISLFFLALLGLKLRTSCFAKKALYHLSHSTSPIFHQYVFKIGSPELFAQSWFWTVILLISAYWEAVIIDVSHKHLTHGAILQLSQIIFYRSQFQTNISLIKIQRSIPRKR